eukprot:SAG11_NODE_23466_length_388_cov_0.716263_1_plen_22_part_10
MRRTVVDTVRTDAHGKGMLMNR